MTILSKNDQKGRSMVEMLGVLAIIGVLSVGGISGYSKAMGKFKMTKAQDQMSMVLMNVRTAFATSPSYEGLTNETAAEFGIVPSEMIPAGEKIGTNISGKLINAFGGPFEIADCKSNAGLCTLDNDEGAADEQFFAIGLANLNREACLALAAVDWGSDGLMGMTIVDQGNPIDPGTALSAGDDNLVDQFPLSMAVIAGSCGEYSTITWTYY